MYIFHYKAYFVATIFLQLSTSKYNYLLTMLITNIILSEVFLNSSNIDILGYTILLVRSHFLCC